MTAGSRPEDGDLLVSTGPQGSWAWVGASLEPEPTMAEHGGFAGLPEEQRRTETASREQIWLAEQWAPGGQHRFEIRYWNEPAARRVSCALLGQVYDPDRAGAESAARALRARLLSVPRHVRADGLDATGVRSALTLFGQRHQDSPRHSLPGSAGDSPTGSAGGRAEGLTGGLAEVRKRLTWAWSTRHDARFRVGVMVFPLAAGSVSWEPVWDALARQDHLSMISVGLEPCAAGEGLRSRLGFLAQEYGRLAVPGTPNPVYQQPVPPDPFAMRAAPLHQDAAHRYTGRAYRLRITVAAEGPSPTHLAELVAAAVSAPPESAVVVVPRGGEAEAAWGSVTALNRTWLEETYGQGVPAGRLGPVERMLSDLVDLPEAAAAFRFPYEIPGRPPLFDTVARRTAEDRARPSETGTGAGTGASDRGAADPHFPAF